MHQVRAHPVLPDLVVAAAAVGFAESLDAGATWTVAHDGLHAHYLRAVAFTRTVDPVQRVRRPARRPVGAVPARDRRDGAFERCRDGLPEWLAGNIDTGGLDSATASATPAPPRSETSTARSTCRPTTARRGARSPPTSERSPQSASRRSGAHAAAECSAPSTSSITPAGRSVASRQLTGTIRHPRADELTRRADSRAPSRAAHRASAKPFASTPTLNGGNAKSSRRVTPPHRHLVLTHGPQPVGAQQPPHLHLEPVLQRRLVTTTFEELPQPRGAGTTAAARSRRAVCAHSRDW